MWDWGRVPRQEEERRAALEKLLVAARPPLYLTPATRDRALATTWLRDFEGAGLDGVIAKPLDAAYQPGKRAMLKIKHQRTADCVVAGFRWHKNGPGTHVGSLLLGLFGGGVYAVFLRTLDFGMVRPRGERPGGARALGELEAHHTHAWALTSAVSAVSAATRGSATG